MTLLSPHHFEKAQKPALTPLGRYLSVEHGLSMIQISEAQITARKRGLTVEDILYSQYGISRRAVAKAHSALAATQLIDPVRLPPDPALVAAYCAEKAVRAGVLPWRRMGDCVVVLVSHPDNFPRNRAYLERVFGPVRMALTTEDHLQTTICRSFGATLVARAEKRVPAAESSRNWRAALALRIGLGVLATLAIATFFAPVVVLFALTAVAVGLLAIGTALKTAAAIIGGRPSTTQSPNVTLARLPMITLLIPLYREQEIADQLLTRLEAIDYPRELLDVCLVLEANDTTTRDAIGRSRLLTWMRPVVVPDGSIRTKPRALNYALDFAKGSIIGVYDAEDAPAPDQLRVVAAHFAGADPRTACLQGTLDYYNPRANWLTRCFTLEYAAWFRVVLPGLARMGLVVPLGGTTLFFRRDILELLGGWDAHNVTEDADLGVRLARHGYRTEFVATVTEEEANGRAWPWVKQRSRWLKGYAITYGVHMRNPLKLWRDLGTWRFFGVQVLFLGTLSQFVLAPLLWTFWLIPFGWSHPVADLLPPVAFWSMVGLFVASELSHLVISWIAVRRAGKTWLTPWALSMQLYFPLAVLAVYKGLLELTWKPFFWDKTAHGVSLPETRVTPPPLPRPTSVG